MGMETFFSSLNIINRRKKRDRQREKAGKIQDSDRSFCFFFAFFFRLHSPLEFFGHRAWTKMPRTC